MSWFWFWAFALLLLWNVFLMRTLSISQADVRRLVRREQIRSGRTSIGGER